MIELKEQLTKEQIFELLEEWGGHPTLYSNYIVSDTICHNPPEQGSNKLYYYFNTHLFHCYTGCNEPSFDVFELCIKVMKIQFKINFSLIEAIKWVAYRFNLSTERPEEKTQLKDWEIFEKYQSLINPTKVNILSYRLPIYDASILENFNYNLKLVPWLNDGIGQEAIRYNHIGYYPGGDQITIPHYDKDDRFIGLRGRTLCEADAKEYGKYRPIKINGQMYNHPLGLNLYNLNNSKYQIKQMKKAIVLESEKSTLQFQTLFGPDKDISVACCGSNLTSYQIQLLLQLGVEEIIVAFDRQFQNKGDKEYQQLTKKLKNLQKRYKNYVNLSYILDKNKITSYKASPTDEGIDKFLQLFNERVF